jgi:hypothetical protein
MSDTYKGKEMDEVKFAMLVDEAAKLISGAPFPSKQSLTKARKVVELILASQQPQGVMENVSDELLVLAADFETCIPFLPRVGAQNIGSRVKQLRRIALGIAAPPAAAVPDGLLDELRDVALESDGSSGARSAIRVAFDEAEKRIAPAPGVSND